MRRRLLIKWLVNALALAIVAWLLPGIDYEGTFALLIAAVVLGLVNTFIRPVLVVLSIPVTIVTLGLFLLVINALMLLFTSWLVGGFVVAGFWTALGGSILLSVFSWIISGFFPKNCK